MSDTSKKILQFDQIAARKVQKAKIHLLAKLPGTLCFVTFVCTRLSANESCAQGRRKLIVTASEKQEEMFSQALFSREENGVKALVPLIEIVER